MLPVRRLLLWFRLVYLSFWKLSNFSNIPLSFSLYHLFNFSLFNFTIKLFSFVTRSSMKRLWDFRLCFKCLRIKGVFILSNNELKHFRAGKQKNCGRERKRRKNNSSHAIYKVKLLSYYRPIDIVSTQQRTRRNTNVFIIDTQQQ